MHLGNADANFQWSYEGADRICLVTFIKNINLNNLLHFILNFKGD